jgi:hypothetical protein
VRDEGGKKAGGKAGKRDGGKVKRCGQKKKVPGLPFWKVKFAFTQDWLKLFQGVRTNVKSSSLTERWIIAIRDLLNTG